MVYDDVVRQGGSIAMLAAERFLMSEGPVFETLLRISAMLDALQIPYAVAGGMALVAHGYNRTTVDVDILVTSEGLQTIHDKLSGLGYVEPFAGSKNLRDTSSNVRIEFLVAGQYPGDGKPKPVAFPDPAQAATDIGGVRYLGLASLVELKLASGLTGGVSRLKDFADVVELIQILDLQLEFSDQLNPYVKEKYIELWTGLRAP